MLKASHAFCVAPMMGYTNRHCRFFHRLLSKKALLYTEMITAQAVVYGDITRLLSYSSEEHPVACQIGGCNPELISIAATKISHIGYDEINLNIGCPSPRVKSGQFGACMMASPSLVRECLSAIIEAVNACNGYKKPCVSIKMRIGIDQQNPIETLPVFIEEIIKSGVKVIIIHARKAITDRNFSPRYNNNVPALDYELVIQMQKIFPDVEIIINGGIKSIKQGAELIERGVSGFMIGRSVINQPLQILGQVDKVIYNEPSTVLSPHDVVRLFEPYLHDQINKGHKVVSILRNLTPLFNGYNGARKWRRFLSELHGEDTDMQLKQYMQVVEQISV